MLKFTSHRKFQDLAIKNPLVIGNEQILILGAGGQIGKTLLPHFRQYYASNLVLADKRPGEGIIEFDITEDGAIERLIKEYKAKVLINLVAPLSAEAQKKSGAGK